MKIQQQKVINISLERLWVSLHDPAILASTIPWIDSFQEDSLNEYRFSINVGMGAILGKFSGKIVIEDIVKGSQYVMYANAKGPGGWIKGKTLFQLLSLTDSKSQINIKSDLHIGGVLERVGKRLMKNVARNQVDKFFKQLERVQYGQKKEDNLSY